MSAYGQLRSFMIALKFSNSNPQNFIMWVRVTKLNEIIQNLLLTLLFDHWFWNGTAVRPGLTSVPLALLKASICSFVTLADSGSMLLSVVSLNNSESIAIESGGCFCHCAGAGKLSWFGTAIRLRISSRSCCYKRSRRRTPHTSFIFDIWSSCRHGWWSNSLLSAAHQWPDDGWIGTKVSPNTYVLHRTKLVVKLSRK